jgi:ribulose-5-phosphate 4-epimerase/fuculose-1-phosphate aldolase
VSYQPADAAGAVVLAALACRALAAAGQADMVWGHASVRDPGGRGVWMKGAGWGLEEVDASKILLVSPDGEVLDGTGPRHIEYLIHTGIMAVRADVGAVVHTHSAAANAFSALDAPLRPLDHAGSLFCYPDLPRFTLTGGLIATPELGAALASALGGARACLMPQHGLVTAGPDTPTAVMTAVLLDRACRTQLDAMSAGPLRRWGGEADTVAKRAEVWSDRQLQAGWEYLLRRLLENLVTGVPDRIGVAGDWHGNTAWATRAVRKMAVLLPSSAPRVIVHLGDFGIWPGPDGREYLSEVTAALAEADAELWFVDGNHEDFSQLARLRPGPDGRSPVTERIWYLPRGHRWRWHGREWLALGGAVSVDRALRTAGVDWWPEEEITWRQAGAVIDAGHADVMVTHDCPAGVPHTFPPPPRQWAAADLRRSEAHRGLLREVVLSVEPRWLMHGHLHMGYQRTVDLGRGPVEITGLDRDGAEHSNWAILDVAGMRWLRFQGKPISNAIRGLVNPD